MLFTSFVFLAFLVLAVGGNRLLRPFRRSQNVFLLLMSYLFYGWWDWRFLSLIWLSTIVDYIVAARVHQCTDQTIRKRWLGLSLVANLGALGIFKYFDFFSTSLEAMVRPLGIQIDAITLGVILPVGISFYTFQTLSYTIDVYRGRQKPCRDPVLFGLFVCFFPQLVAGPIERASDLIPQLAGEKSATRRQIAEGFVLVTYGLFLKIVVADGLAPDVDSVFAVPQLPFMTLLGGVLGFSLQIYGDFCGYSLIARGAARFLGVDLMRNFRTPYFAVSIQDFWRRWHVSLSSWLRDYLYVSLGGNRKGSVRTYTNLMLTMLLGGLWHGAGWNFVIWGGIHGGALACHRLASVRLPTPQSRPGKLAADFLGWSLTFLVVTVAWIFFRAGTLADAIAYCSGLMTLRGGLALSGTMLLFKIVFLCAMILPFEWVTFRHDDELILARLRPLILGLCMAAAWVAITGGFDGAKSFIYFQF